MVSAVLGLLLAGLQPQLAESVTSFTLTCLDKARAGLNAFGGIGGVVHAGGNRWWMVSEGLPLIFPVDLDLRSSELRPQIGPPITIHADPRRGEFRKVEAITLCHDRFLIGTEAMMARELKSNRDEDIRVMTLDQQGRYLGELPLPEHYQRLRPGMGTFYYRGVQGLSCSPDGRLLLVSLQRPLQQDGETAMSRHLLFRWQPSSQNFLQVREFLVPLDHQLGMMDIALMGNGEALILENEVKPRQRNTLSSFRIDDGDDISACRSLRDCPRTRPARKTPVLAHIEQYAGVDLLANEVQYDALGPGPTLSDGRRTLLLVNDDDHCGTITSPTASIAPGFAGTTFTRVILPPAGSRPR